MRGKELLTAGAVVLATATSSFAAGLDLSSVSVDLTPVYTLAGTIVTAGVGLFAVRKVIKLMNRS